ncbi:MAG: agmatinase [Nanoarchaeota archaeon]|nr:agmatinase [Nanoarchaeota archaeon]
MKMQDYGGLDAEYCSYNVARIVILPVAYDGTSSWIKGADKGPQALLDSSCNMELYDVETDSEVYKQGIYTDEPITDASSPELMVEAVEQRVSELLTEGKTVVLIGGEHSISIGSILAHKKHYSNISTLQIDAHADLRDTYQGSKCNHACVMARVKEICPFVQVGIRSMDSSEKKNMDINNVFFAKDIQDNDDWMDKAVSLLSDEVYITIDVDAFDPSELPATGTPEPGGMNWWQVLKLLKKVNAKKNIVGFDVVELCPNPHSQPSNFLAAKLVYKLLSYIFTKKDLLISHNI